MIEAPEKKGMEELQRTAEMLEQILEVMPDDLLTLRALYDIALQLERVEKALDYLARLDDLARSTQNLETIHFVLDQYKALETDAPEVLARIGRLSVLLENLGEAPETGTEVKAGAVLSGTEAIEPEMALAWELLQDEQLSQEEYSEVLHDLTEMSARQVGVPVTVLHVLHDRQFSRFEKLMSHLCQKKNIPIISLSQFDEQEELYHLLSVEFMSRCAIIPFATIGDDLLVGVLNPYEHTLMRRVEQMTGKRCHPYLVTPEEYDERLGVIKKAAQE